MKRTAHTAAQGSALTLCTLVLLSACGPTTGAGAAPDGTVTYSGQVQESPAPAPEASADTDTASSTPTRKAITEVSIQAILKAMRTPIDVQIPRTFPGPDTPARDNRPMGPDGPMRFVQSYVSPFGDARMTLRHVSSWTTGTTDSGGVVTLPGEDSISFTPHAWIETPSQIVPSWEFTGAQQRLPTTASGSIPIGRLPPTASQPPTRLAGYATPDWPNANLQVWVERDYLNPEQWKLCTDLSVDRGWPRQNLLQYLSTTCGVYDRSGTLVGATARNGDTQVRWTGHESRFDCVLPDAAGNLPAGSSGPACVRGPWMPAAN